MRDIKFRVWFEGKWNYFKIGQSMTDYQYAIYSQCCLLGLKFYEYTGLKDKHGKEIYEGDIIQDVIVGMKSEVVFTDYANFGIKSLEGISDLEYDVIDPSWTSTSVIIIGTIYENPELCQK